MDDSPVSPETRLEFPTLRQPDDVTCGPTCLHAVYRFFGERVRLHDVIDEIPMLDEGGTLASYLGSHALLRGYLATIYVYNLRLFDPTWFAGEGVDIREKLIAQAEHKKSRRLKVATNAYLEFLKLGGALRFEDLTRRVIRDYLQRGIPIMTGLSVTYLHRSMREYGTEMAEDDILGEPTGHFVVLCGYDPATRRVCVADPLWPNPYSSKEHEHYWVAIDRVIGAILLGVITYDANLLIIEPRRDTGEKHRRR